MPYSDRARLRSVGQLVDGDELLAFDPLNRPSNRVGSNIRAEVANASDFSIHYGAAPGPKNRIEAMGSLCGELDLDCFNGFTNRAGGDASSSATPRAR